MMSPHEQLAGYRQWLGKGGVGPDPIECGVHGGHAAPISRPISHALDADLECTHGRVPIEGCEHGCHLPQPIYRPAYFQPAPTPDLIEAMPKRKPKPKPVPMPPLIAAVVSDLDREIGRLTEARDRIVASQTAPLERVLPTLTRPDRKAA